MVHGCTTAFLFISTVWLTASKPEASVRDRKTLPGPRRIKPGPDCHVRQLLTPISTMLPVGPLFSQPLSGGGTWMTWQHRLYLKALGLAVAFASVASGAPVPGLSQQIDAVIQAPQYRQARWGVLVVDAESGRSLFERDADRLFVPASTTKLFSCAAALVALGPDYRFQTPVYRRGRLKDGHLTGDLILVAQGDLTLGGRTDSHGQMLFKDNDHIYAGFRTSTELTATDPLAGLNDLAQQVAATGIRQVIGDVLIDDRLFVHATGSGSGPAQLTPIMINDNVIDVIVKPGASAGAAAQVRVRPETNYIQVDAQVGTVAAGRTARLEVRAPDPQHLVVRGAVPVASRPRTGIHPISDPTGFARALFIEALRRHGVAVSASMFDAPQAPLPDQDEYKRLTRVATFTSPPFSEAIKVTLKVSHNLYASTLPLLIAVRRGERTLAAGLRWQRQFLSELGVDVSTISFGGGAGGSNADSVTPRATVQLLRAFARRPEYHYLEVGLPILGIDGTLAEASTPNSPARGKVRAKTGTLTWHDVMNNRSLLRSKSMAGVMTTTSGRRLIFAMFVNDVPLPPQVPTSREGKTLGRLCEIIYEQVK